MDGKHFWMELFQLGANTLARICESFPTGMLLCSGGWSCHPKFLVGQANVTVGSSFCQSHRMDSHETERESEQQKLHPNGIRKGKAEEDISALPHSPSYNPQSLLSQARQEPVTSPL
ncbi:hypothetical protein Q5P01_005723 [Channa striata]|uniref:Uncharacterized protein n=1 Tax=Channa striata TaxID=64152 RepID=A0AA88SYT1_CHASR|nr:hypothetical protein Q5P01_005723 [Channa striata]